MNWYSQADQQGSADVRDPAMETVQSTESLTQTDILVREALQNSLDAVDDPEQPVIVSFRLKLYDAPARDAFLSAISWPILASHVKAHRDLLVVKKRPLRIVKPEAVEGAEFFPVLFIDDRNTRGLRGAEFDPAQIDPDPGPGPHSFVGLCRNFGDNQKSQGSFGGTHGFGKTVYWKNSAVFTVLFDSVLADPWLAWDGPEVTRRFIGVSRMRARYVENQLYNQPLILTSGHDEARGRPLSSWNDAAAKMSADVGFPARDDQSPGTTIAIVGAIDPNAEEIEFVTPARARSFLKEMVAAAEKWFWPAVSEGKLIVRGYVNDDLVASLEEVSAADLLPFVEAYQKAKQQQVSVQVKVPRGEDVNEATAGLLHIGFSKLVAGIRLDDRLKNRVALVRGPLMVVGYQHFARKGLSLADYVGVTLAGFAVDRWDPKQKAVEILLARSEPVTHDKWTPDAELLKGWHGSRAAVRRVLDEIKRIVQGETGGETVETGEAAPELARLLALGNVPGSGAGHVVAVERSKKLRRIDMPDGTSHYEVEYKLRVPPIKSPDWGARRRGKSPSAVKVTGRIGYLSMGASNERRIDLSLTAPEATENGNMLPAHLHAGETGAVLILQIDSIEREVRFAISTKPIPTALASALRFQDQCQTRVGYVAEEVTV